MKKFVMFVLLVMGWGLVYYLVQNPPTTRVYVYYPEVDFGETHTVSLGDGESIVFHKKTDVRSQTVWDASGKITLAQLNQYRINCFEPAENAESNSTAKMVALDEAEGFCKWLSWRESEKGCLPSGYDFSVVKPDDYRGYVDIGDKIHLVDGFSVRLQAKRQTVQHAPLSQKLQAAEERSWSVIFKHPVISTALLIAAIFFTPFWFIVRPHS